MAKKKAPFNVNASIRGAIRRVFARSPIVIEVKMSGRRDVPKYNKDGSRSKKDAVQYQCQVCENWVGSNYISVDHIEPVISIEDGFQDWNTFVARLWCDKSNLQRICDDCHHTKTQEERFARTFKQEKETLADIECGKLSREEQKKWLKKFTPKKLLKYPKDFVDTILSIKQQLKK